MIWFYKIESLYIVAQDYAEFNFARDYTLSGNPDYEPLTDWS